MGKASTPRSIEHLTEVLRSLPIPLHSALLFGSRVRGDYLEDSDWDLVLVSDSFGDVPFPERITRVLRHLPVDGVELFCYTREEFEEGKDGFGVIAVALGEGLELIGPGSAAREGPLG